MVQSLRGINFFCIFCIGSMLGGSQLPENPASEDLVPSGGLSGYPYECTYTPTQSHTHRRKAENKAIFMQSRK